MANLRRINQEDLRNHNLSVTLDTLLRAQKPMSRADLAKETGLTKATLSLLASMLIESGVVQEGEPVVSTTYGRPSTPLEIRGGSIAGIGLQINTDGYGCLALDLNGDTLGREWVSEDMTGTDPYEIFAKLDVKLVDFKIEMGRATDGTLLLADEITPDSCRLWDQKDHSGKVEHLEGDVHADCHEAPDETLCHRARKRGEQVREEFHFNSPKEITCT